ncbi:MAG: hypothetical protein LAO79_06775 [Acidobacteriia bacterium]|nr:hypothetical protein [Terriglobia bacterium]
MQLRFLTILAAATMAISQAQTKTKSVARTPDGHPDLQGIWTNATLTPLERPAQFANKPTLSEAEATAYEKSDLKTNDIDDPEAPLLARAGSGSGETAVGGYNNLFIDRGTQLARVDGVKRTSLIIDPPDGRIPATRPLPAPRAPGASANQLGRFDSVKDRPLAERCLVGFGSTSGPPMLPVLYNNTYQIVQTPDYVMILVEMVHDVRVVRMNQKHAPSSVRRWFGDSVGHWEGDTLVVDTTNFNGQNRFRGAGENLHVIERFQRVDPNTILYRATVEDPQAYSKPWTLEYPFNASAGPIYEYACHEGNYAMPDILGGARKLEGASTKK